LETLAQRCIAKLEISNDLDASAVETLRLRINCLANTTNMMGSRWPATHYQSILGRFLKIADTILARVFNRSTLSDERIVGFIKVRGETRGEIDYFRCCKVACAVSISF
jgi:hypothetical protein